MITIEQAKAVLKLLKPDFDAHDFIAVYVAMYPREYLDMVLDVTRENTAILNITQVNKGIAKFLRDNTKLLNIQEVDTTQSYNILWNKSVCSTWKKN